jgi:RNase P/RNase MRP subunit p30
MSQFSQLKEREANRRMRLIRQARKSRRSARAIQRRVSLAGGADWKITNWSTAVSAMAKWA